MRSSVAVCLVLIGAVSACGQPDNAESVPASATARPPNESVVAVGFMVGAPKLVAVSPGHLVIWDTDSAKVLRRQRLDGSSLRFGGVLSPGARQLVFSRFRGERAFETHLLNVDTGTTVMLAPPGSESGRFAITEDGTTLLRATGTGSPTGGPVQMQSWRLPSGTPLAKGTIESVDGFVVSVATSPTGDRFALSVNRRTRENGNLPGPKGRIYIGEGATSRVLATIDTPDIAAALMFSADGAQLYWGDNSDAQVHVADAVSGKPVAAFGDAPDPAVVYRGRGGVPGAVQMMAVTPTWTHMVTAQRAGSAIQIWNAANQTLVQSVPLTGRATSVGVSIDGARFAVGTMDGTVAVWEIRTPTAPTHTFSIR